MSKKIGIACDHAGFEYKESIISNLRSKGYIVTDYGCFSTDSVDYPDFAHQLAQSIEDGSNQLGIQFCGSGNGINMSANKHQSVRSALCWEVEIAELAKTGNESGVDLILEDVVSGPIGLLPSDTTAVNFGKISKIDSEISKQDIAAGIVNLVGQTAARVATSVATTFNAKEIVVVGRSPSFNGLKKSLEQAASIMGFSPHFPKNGEYASALGALLVAEKNPSD